MSLRDKLAVSDLLHGRWRDRGENTPYAYLRFDGEADIGEKGRWIQPVELMQRTSDGLWMPIEVTDADGETVQQEIRCYQTGAGDLRDAILDGSPRNIIYRVGVKKRTYLNKKTGKKETAYEFKVTDRFDTAQSSLPPTSSEPQAAAPGGPSGGPQQSSNGMHSPQQQPAPTASPGPISQAPPAQPATVSEAHASTGGVLVPRAQRDPEQGAKRFCASCGKPTGGISVCPHCGVAQ